MSTIHNPTNLKVNTGTLISQLTLAKTNDAITKSIRNLSTGLRIESGRDDPVGFIAGNSMRTDLSLMAQAVANGQRADSVLSQVDSTLANISNLMNDLRGIVTQAANTGVENAQTLAALQTEADAIISAIDFYSTSSTFNGQKLLDGSLDFNLYGSDTTRFQKIEIRQANFLGRTEKDVAVQVISPPTQAKLQYQLGGLANDVVFTLGGTGGNHVFSFDKSAALSDIANDVNRFSDATGIAARVYSQGTAGSLALTSYGKNNDILVTASEAGTESGNFVVKYSAPKSGNDTAYLNVTQGYANTPTTIEVVLQTEAWANAEYSFNNPAANAPIPNSNNAFTIAAKYAGEEFNNVEFEISNIYGNTDGLTEGISIDFASQPKKFTINVSVNEADPNDPANTTVNDLAQWIADDPAASAYFELRNSGSSNGTGVINPAGGFTLSKEGVDGGKVTSTAEQIAALLNTSPLLKNADGSGRVSATIPAGALGNGVLSPFFDAAYYGNPQENNLLQFLAPENAPTIEFVSVPNESLSIDTTSSPPVYGYASAAVQGYDAGTSFTLKSREPGTQNDNVAVIFRDAAEESAVFDPERNAVVVSVDFSGRASGQNPAGYFTMSDLVNLVDADPIVGSRFSVVPLTPYSQDAPPEFSSSAYIGIDSEVGKTTGGLVSSGTVTIHLETGSDGIVRTTANDLVKFFNDPPTEEAKIILDKLGISVSVISPGNTTETASTTGNSSIGSGLLGASSSSKSADSEWNFGEIEFGKSLPNVNATAYLLAQNGSDAVLQVTARSSDPKYAGTEIVVVANSGGTAVSYDPVSKQITIGIDPNNPPTSQNISDLINSDPNLADLFIATIPNSVGVPLGSQPGSAPIAVGDKGTLRMIPDDAAKAAAAGAAMVGNSDSEEMGLTFYSVGYGSGEFVEVISGAGTSFPVRDKFGMISERAYGTDVVALIDGLSCVGSGLSAVASTTDLDMTLTFNEDIVAGAVLGFRISGGGVLIQLGQVATSSQQARISIPSVHSSELGGVNGFLSQIRSGGISDLTTDTASAFRIIDEITADIASLRGRLGAFQKSRVEANIENLTDAIEIETGAMSDIVDTDFALESSELLRQQLLMQSNVTALQLSMQSRQMLLGLLTG
ncbi:MAG: hypothetical protein LBQ66_09985 [Planctomycetaceae bacterium]|jgi:flagellin-like hook-associated protein FlgL|nr:hypothetical protein [Planctomycetaceae bacterium]